MIIKTRMQLKALVNNRARGDGNLSTLYYMNYMYERLIARLSVSRYKENFVIKGGFLLSSITGVGLRMTHDLDATTKGLVLSLESAKDIFSEIISIDLKDNISYEIYDAVPISIRDATPGVRLLLKGHLDSMRMPLSIDITMGDETLIRGIDYHFPTLFGDDYIDVIAYDLETIISEKIHAVLSIGTASTRLRDYYDINLIYLLYQDKIDYSLLSFTINLLFTRKNDKEDLDNYKNILKDIKESKQMLSLWKNYQLNNSYAKGVDFYQCLESIELILDRITHLN